MTSASATPLRGIWSYHSDDRATIFGPFVRTRTDEAGVMRKIPNRRGWRWMVLTKSLVRVLGVNSNRRNDLDWSLFLRMKQSWNREVLPRKRGNAVKALTSREVEMCRIFFDKTKIGIYLNRTMSMRTPPILRYLHA